MRVFGRTQDTRRLFRFWTIGAFGSTLIVTVEVILTNFQLYLSNGGTAGMFWGYLYVVFGFILVYSRMAGLASTVGFSFLTCSPIRKVDRLHSTQPLGDSMNGKACCPRH